jgi:Ser/Thr protein kinase RdoA (MazF antagonist)
MTSPHPDIFSADDLRFNPPTFAASELAGFLQRQYGVRGEFRELEGERDQNFRVTRADGQQFVLKISGIGEDASVVDFQLRALEHVKTVDPELPVPRHVAGFDGEFVSRFFDAEGNAYHVRLLTYLDGSPLYQSGAPGRYTIQNLGRLQARLSLALRDFSHPAATHFMPWDAMNGLVVSEALCRDYLPCTLVDSCAAVLERLRKTALPALRQLPTQVIHNDMHLQNVLVDPARPEEITGIIDFGDIVQRPLVQDLGTSLVMIAESTSDLVSATVDLLAGFGEVSPLPAEQRELLYDALCARAILSVQLTRFYQLNVEGSDKYDDDDIAGVIKSLECILATDRNDFTRAIQGSAQSQCHPAKAN